MKIAKICLPKGSGKRLKVRGKSVKSQGILKWILSGNPGNVNDCSVCGVREMCLREIVSELFSV